MLLKTLPPLKSLVFFESAARLKSFTLASRELNVTQGAVSRQIRQLEAFLGKPLFRRQQRQVFLTDDGHNYFVSVAHHLSQLESATTTLKGPTIGNPVTFVTSSALAPMYLLPRLPEFRQQHPEISIRIVARDSIQDLRQFNYDLGLYYSRSPPTHVDAIGLFDECVFPVCSPRYLQQHQQRLSDPKQLSQDLIWLESNEDWINWPEWFESMQISVPPIQNRLIVNHYSMVIQAAIAGQGVALAWGKLADDEIKRGTLLKPFDIQLETGSQFYIIMPSNKPTDHNTQVFKRWLQDNR